ncbi:MAG: heme-binding domain-containing protein [Bacteroidales bacterium]|nr:heme-binding domain-containing protein [Bacteroidales bacterium]
MKKIIKILLIFFLGIFVIIQFIPSGRPGNEPVAGQDIFEIASIPDDVGVLLKNACFDCHSQSVKYPWYSYVAPVSWLVARDVKFGRENLDFGKWGELSKRDKMKILGEISDEVGDGFMPMQIYITMHSEANLSDEERELIVNWAEELAEKIFEE